MTPPTERRKKPNLVAFSKVFVNHGLLLLAKGFDEYERDQEAMRSGFWMHESTPSDADILDGNWHFFENLIDISDFYGEPVDERLENFACEKQVYKIFHRIDEIWDIYEIFLKSIDFEPVRSSDIRAVLLTDKKGKPIPDLLDQVQVDHLSELNSSIQHWVFGGQDDRWSLWEAFLFVQSEIEKSQKLSEQSIEVLEEILEIRSHAKRPRAYAPAVLVILLAELFEDYGDFGDVATYNEDRYQQTKKEYESEQDSLDEHQNRPWSQGYLSKFSAFLEVALGSELAESVGRANASKIIKNRKKMEGQRLTYLIHQSSTEHDFIKVIELIDLVKP